MRLDRFLWFVRATKTRAEAQRIAETGTLRIDGRVIDRAHAVVRVGHVLTFAHGDIVRIIRVETLPVRRGPASEARACYVELGDAASAIPAVRSVDVHAPQT